MLIKKDFTFDAAHFLPNYHGKCETLHGHTYSLSVTLEGDPGADGMIIDFKEFSELVQLHILSLLDHQNLNQQFTNPTTEIIAQWIYDKMNSLFDSTSLRLFEIMLSESSASHIIIRRDA